MKKKSMTIVKTEAARAIVDNHVGLYRFVQQLGVDERTMTGNWSRKLNGDLPLSFHEVKMLSSALSHFIGKEKTIEIIKCLEPIKFAFKQYDNQHSKYRTKKKAVQKRGRRILNEIKRTSEVPDQEPTRDLQESGLL